MANFMSGSTTFIKRCSGNTYGAEVQIVANDAITSRSAARKLGAATVLLCFNPYLRFARGCRPDAVIAPATGPEVLTGSTRLKAGTATKLVLNMLTTGAMIRVGKTFGNLMVDLRATNLKLVDRSQRIIMEVCHVTRDEARELIARADGRVKLAIVMHLLGVDKEGAEAALAKGDGVIRRVVGGDPPPIPQP